MKPEKCGAINQVAKPSPKIPSSDYTQPFEVHTDAQIRRCVVPDRKMRVIELIKEVLFS